ncbi:DnaJ domain-containing protein [Phellopilus nigrolimitatus]|nr:DnaJ domain-containing protein [Phellopilus nigrolimitatus]
MSADGPETNPYELLKVGLEATDQEIKSAYRKLSLKVHPDRNRNNPDAAQKFHELNQAYELLLDPLRRLALTSSVRTKEVRKAHFSRYDRKRKNHQEELERERAFKKQGLEKAKEAREREQENERIKEAGRKLREEKEEEVLKKKAEKNAKIVDDEEDEDEVPPLGQLDTTMKLKYSLSSHPGLITASALSSLLSQFGEIDTSSIIGTALVPFKQIGGAFSAACASGRKEYGLEGVEVTWAGRKEPPILEWLKKQGKLSAEP